MAVRAFTVVLLFLGLVTFAGCKTRSEIRREQEIERMKQDVSQVRGVRADMEQQLEDLKTEVSRLQVLMDEQLQVNRSGVEELKREVAALGTRMQAIEQRAVEEEMASRRQAEERSKASFENGKRLYDEERYEEAASVFDQVARTKAKSDEGKKAQFFLGEAHFNAKDYASAALAFSEFIKDHPKDAMVPNAIYRQAQAFRAMGKGKEAKLFYQELVERFPKSQLSSKAKAEMKKLK